MSASRILQILPLGSLPRHDVPFVAPAAVSLEIAVCQDAPGVHDTLGDALPVEVADLLQELVVLQRGGAPGTDRALVLVVVDRMPCRLVSTLPSSPGAGPVLDTSAMIMNSFGLVPTAAGGGPAGYPAGPRSHLDR